MGRRAAAKQNSPGAPLDVNRRFALKGRPIYKSVVPKRVHRQNGRMGWIRNCPQQS
jgi:hypothetical protein